MTGLSGTGNCAPPLHTIGLPDARSSRWSSWIRILASTQAVNPSGSAISPTELERSLGSCSLPMVGVGCAVGKGKALCVDLVLS